MYKEGVRTVKINDDVPKYVLVRYDDPNIVLLHGSQDKVGDSIKIKPATVTFQGNMLLFE